MVKAKNSPVPVQVQEVLRVSAHSAYIYIIIYNYVYNIILYIIVIILYSLIYIRTCVCVRNVLIPSLEVSLKLDPSGWAWIVHDDKAYCWRYNSSQATVSAV